MLNNETRTHIWQGYTAMLLYGLGRVLAGDSWTAPTYDEAINGSAAKADKRSSKEIREDLIGKLTG
jgi:hypothetical protein